MRRAFGCVNLLSGTTIAIVTVVFDLLHRAQRHRGEDKTILKKRHELHEQAKQKRPERWSGNTRNWEPVGVVNLNPEREGMSLKKAA